MFGIEWPVYLWALAGMLFPLLIHLWNRQRSVPVKTGSVRWLKASKSSKVSKVRLTQLALLLLRLTLLAVFVVLLAQPFWHSDSQEETKDIVLVQPALLKLEAVSDQLAVLRKEGKEIRLLEKGFPLWKETKDFAEKEPADVWALLQLAGEELLIEDTLQVFTYESARYFGQNKPVLPFITDWKLIPSRNTEYFLAEAKWNHPHDSLIFTIGSARSDELVFDTYTYAWDNQPAFFSLKDKGQKLSVFLNDKQEWQASLGEHKALNIQENVTLRIFIHHEQAFQTDYQYIKAALSAIRKYSEKEIQWNDLSDQDISDEDWIFWLSDGPVPDSLKESSMHLLMYEPSELSRLPLIGKRGGFYRLNRRLNPEFNSNTLGEPLASELDQLLFGTPKAWKSAEKYDLRAVSAQEVQPYFELRKENRNEPTPVGLHEWVWAVLVFLFIVERSLALWKTH